MSERWFNLKQDFWRGLYVTISRFELSVHFLAVRIFDKIDYSSIYERQSEENEHWERHPFRKRR